MIPLQFEMQGKEKLKGAFASLERHLREVPERRRAQLERIINKGVWKNHKTLSMGGGVRQAGGGGSIAWLQVRHPRTLNIRDRYNKRGLRSGGRVITGGSGFIGAVFPILKLTGKLQDGLKRGGTSHTVGNTLVWEPDGQIADLLNVHEHGLAPLRGNRRAPLLSGGLFTTTGSQALGTQRTRSTVEGVGPELGEAVIGKVPPRPSVFWSQEMATEAIRLVRNDMRGR